MKEDNDLEEIEFDWDEYLKLTGSEAAPKSCFRQNEIPPVNEFVIGQKLETVDPRNRSSMCIATVIDTCGSRIRLRLDGTDDRNDFWLLVDSEFIHPFEYTTKNGGTIQPPLGFRNNLSTWPRFFDKIVQSAQEDTFAAESCFKPPPTKPPKNEFKKGQKLEAIDQKNPHLICPATITDVDKDNLHISFDGWSQSCSFWCNYASRDIFPVGWCKLSKHPLQHPGQYDETRRKPNRRSASNSLNVSGKLNDSIKQQPNQLNESIIKTDPHDSLMTSRPASPVANGTNTTVTNTNTNTNVPTTNNITSSNTNLPPSTDTTSNTTVAAPPPTTTPTTTLNGTTHTNGTKPTTTSTTNVKEKPTETTTTTTTATPLKQNKAATNQTKTSTKIDLSIVKTEPVVNNESIQTNNNESSKTNNKNDTNNSEYNLNASKKENVSGDQIYVYINPKVECGEYLNTEKFHKNYKKFGPEIPKTLFKMVLQSFIDCAYDSSKIFDLIQDGDSTSYIKFKASNRNERKHLPKIENETQLWTNLNLMCKSFNISENLFSKTPLNAAISTKKDSSSTTNQNNNNNNNKPSKWTNDDNSNSNNRNGHKSPDKPVTNQKSLKRRSSSTESYKNQKILKTDTSNNPSSWDVNQVGNYVLQADPNLASHIETLKYQEIDGKALLLLTTDVMMKYMGLKLGPAIKLNNIIERLKKR